MKKDQTDVRSAGGPMLLSRLSAAKLPDTKAHIIFWSITVLGISLDLWSKSAIFRWLERRPDGRFPIIDGFLHLVIALNDGAAFNLFAGHLNWLIAVSVIALTVIIVIFLLSGSRHSLLYVALALFTAGVCGNLYDRIFNEGRVRDFIDVVYWPGRHWPAFNVADSMLCIAVVLLFISTYRTGEHAE
ncbi:MAG: signal peptidase II [Planctomycetota bacterium]